MESISLQALTVDLTGKVAFIAGCPETSINYLG